MGMLGVLAMHAAHKVPLNLHISGTLLEAVAWHCPSFIPKLRGYLDTELIEVVGSSYGQNIMRFFGPDYNRRQLNEELYLYQTLLGVDPSKVKTFWPPERVWETRAMAPVLRDAALFNEGYRYVILDDRTLLSQRDRSLPRALFDKGTHWTPDVYRAHEIENGMGLIALPIATRLRRSIPPKQDEDWRCVRRELEALLVHTAAIEEGNLLALYADDMEKVIGVWGADGPPRYAEFLEWVASSAWIKPVRLTDWARANPPAGRRKVETGTFAELAQEFEAGEGYEKWFHSEQWAPYREHFEWTECRVREAKSAGGDPALIELAEKQLLVSNWETAWHTPATGAHGDPTDSGKPSPWARALTSHCRHAAVTAEAARWKSERDGLAHVEIRDADHDGEPDLVFKNDGLFAFLSKRWGGRVVMLYTIDGPRGAMVVGNPCDDWNFLEDLNCFMETPRNHPGAFADVGFENDEYACKVVSEGERACVQLTNIQRESAARGLIKTYTFDAASPALNVHYQLPPTLDGLSVECGLSPDYLTLLRCGSNVVEPVGALTSRGFAAGSVSVVMEVAPEIAWEKPLQEWVGHGRTLRVGAQQREFSLALRIGNSLAGARVKAEEAA
jgi:starch synthase